jgi:hypothetical protein
MGDTPATLATSINVRLEAFFGSDDDTRSADLPDFFGMNDSGFNAGDRHRPEKACAEGEFNKGGADTHWNNASAGLGII